MWTIHHHQSLSEDTVNFIRKHLEESAKDPLGYFYLLIKLHKQPISGHPVCSDCGSLAHALGRWVDKTLQPIVKDQAFYLKNSAALKEELERIELPPNASLCTYNVVAMYPSINTAQCISHLSEYLSSLEITSKYRFSSEALIEALTLLMLNNCMRVGDIIVKQLSGLPWACHQPQKMPTSLWQSTRPPMCFQTFPKLCSTFSISLIMVLVSGFTIHIRSSTMSLTALLFC